MAVTDDITPVASPGPRPSAFVFPFAEADAAASALRDMIDELDDVIRIHGNEVDAAIERFEGTTATSFLTRFDDDMADLRQMVADLRTERTELVDAIDRAIDRRAAAEVAIANWTTQSDAYADYREQLRNAS